MERPDYPALFSTPSTYKPPEDHELRHDSQYPNLNSKDYRKKPVNRSPKILPFFEKFAINDCNDCIILAANDIRSRIWDGYVWGFPNVESVGIQEKACFKIHSSSPVTNLAFYKDNIFLNAGANGSLELWSTKSDVRSSTDYCLFRIGNQCEHLGLILAMDIMKADGNKIITGCSEKCLKIWDVGCGDLSSINTWRNAHSDGITGVSSSFVDSIFVSCSRDKSALLWDYRLPRPATALFENHKFSLTSIHWSLPENCYNEDIFIGDESGNVIQVSPKMPNKQISKTKVFDRPIRKVEFQKEKMGVIGNTNCLKVYTQQKDSSDFICLYKNMKSENFIRDILWSRNAENEILTIGWDTKLRKHLIL